MENTSDLSGMEGKLSHALLGHWDGLRGSRKMPACDEFSLMDIYKIASCLIVLDVVRTDDGRLRHRYRFVGTTIVGYRRNRSPADHTGMFVDEITRLYSPELLIDCYVRCTEDGVPNLGKGEWKTDTLSGRYERLAVPLGDEEGVVQQLAVCIDRL
ncbi:MAG TPA: hypothetical protein QGH84_06730 [Rhodospirillales bacterium]|jgi:hypothetical protein|nr:hypothetical protein [Rhodospirillales bacterium]